MNRANDAPRDRDGERSTTVRSTRLESGVKPVLAVAGLAVAGALVGLVPTLQGQLLDAPVTAETLIVGVLAAIAFGLLVVAATELEGLVTERLGDRGGAAAGTVAKYLLVFLALVAVYAPVTRALYPFLRGTDAAGLLDLGYTVVALGVLAAVGVVVYRNLDDLAALAAIRVDPGDVDEPVETDVEGAGAAGRGDSRGN